MLSNGLDLTETVVERKPSHEQHGCWCSYDHATDTTCLWARWKLGMIFRCHHQREPNSLFCWTHSDEGSLG